MTFTDIQKFVLATNNGSLYILHNNKDIIYFASEKGILEGLIKKISLEEKIGSFELFQLSANKIFTIDLNSFIFTNRSFSDVLINNNSKHSILEKKRKIKLFNEKSKKKQISTVLDLNQIHLNPNASKEQSLLKYPIEKIKNLKRCTSCILPETFPYIKFDKEGECNYCKNHKKKNQPRTLEELLDLVEPYRKASNKPEV